MANEGVVYILTNEAMDGLVKIGKTKDLKTRLRDLDHTTVPFPFQCFYAAVVDDMDRVERLMHEALGDRRVRSNREFFRIEPTRARAALRLAELRDVTPVLDVAADEEGERALDQERRRKPNLNMAAIGVPIGAPLAHVDDPSVTCIVTGPQEVAFNGRRMSLTGATKEAYKVMGRVTPSETYQGGMHWTHEGKTLVAIRREKEAELDTPENAPGQSDEDGRRRKTPSGVAYTPS